MVTTALFHPLPQSHQQLSAIRRARAPLPVLSCIGWACRLQPNYYKQKRGAPPQFLLAQASLAAWGADGLFFQVTVLLRSIVALRLLFALFGVLLTSYFVYRYFAHGAAER